VIGGKCGTEETNTFSEIKVPVVDSVNKQVNLEV